MDATVRSFFLGFIKIHILHHAAEGQVYGLWLIDELKRHGYAISPGTLYPVLHSLEEGGLLQSKKKLVNGKIRKYYRNTSKGNRLLKQAKAKVHELVQEVMEK
ncbi:PadR family transcriptional regulator [bacterium]|nr:PadR family transcriptional regulator [bacterium]